MGEGERGWVVRARVCSAEGAREKMSGTPKEDTRERKRVDRSAEDGVGRG